MIVYGTRDPFRLACYAAFFAAFNVAHLARCAAAIFLRTDADMMRFTGAEPVVFAAPVVCDPFRIFAQCARCASAILRREAAETIRVAWCA